jgi:hypothetical protein
MARRTDSGKDHGPGRPGGQRLTAAALLALLAREDAAPSFRELLALTESHDPVSRKHLRLLVRGMTRNGDLIEDLQGRFHLAASAGVDQPAQVGVLMAQGRELVFAGLPIERTRGARLRPGDRVEAIVQGDRASVLRVLAYSPEPIVGELHLRGRHAWIESLCPPNPGGG